jgi:hypothetical protein
MAEEEIPISLDHQVDREEGGKPLSLITALITFQVPPLPSQTFVLYQRAFICRTYKILYGTSGANDLDTNNKGVLRA